MIGSGLTSFLIHLWLRIVSSHPTADAGDQETILTAFTSVLMQLECGSESIMAFINSGVALKLVQSIRTY